MNTISVADAKAHMSALIERAEGGETVLITKRGKTVAKISPVEAPRKPFDFEELKRFTDGMTYQEESAGDFMRRVRDEERY